ncbi:MAG: CDP-alcohol phosphatidyltransferase family protein [Chthonomonadales bacterium]
MSQQQPNFLACRPAHRRWIAAAWRVTPAALIGLRILLAPILYVIAAQGHAGPILLVLLAAGLLSDILDGVIARRLGIATERIRVADTYADGWYWAWIAAAAWRSDQGVIYAMRGPLAGLAGVMIFNYAFDLVRYERLTSFHAYSAKIWGLTLALAAAALLTHRGNTVVVWVALVAGICTNIEGFAIKLLLPRWEHDVPSLFHLLRRRKSL